MRPKPPAQHTVYVRRKEMRWHINMYEKHDKVGSRKSFLFLRNITLLYNLQIAKMCFHRYNQNTISMKWGARMHLHEKQKIILRAEGTFNESGMIFGKSS